MRLLAVALLVAASVAGAQVPRSYTYDFVLDPGGKRHGDVMHGTVRVSGERARVDTHSDGRTDDGYLLIANGGRTVYAVHPENRTYEEHDADEFARVVGTAMRAAGPVLKLSVRDATLDSARLGVGVPVAGRATQRVQLRQRWTVSMRVMGFVKEDMRGTSVAEYWTDPSLPLMRNPIFEIVSTSLTALAAADADFLDHAAAARARLFRGSPLKADIRVTMSAGEGDDDTRLRYEVTKLTAGPVNDADLAVPRGYRKTAEGTFRM